MEFAVASPLAELYDEAKTRYVTEHSDELRVALLTVLQSAHFAISLADEEARKTLGVRSSNVYSETVGFLRLPDMTIGNETLTVHPDVTEGTLDSIHSLGRNFMPRCRS